MRLMWLAWRNSRTYPGRSLWAAIRMTPGYYHALRHPTETDEED